MQSVLSVKCFICIVSLLCSALYVKCLYYVVLFVQIKFVSSSGAVSGAARRRSSVGVVSRAWTFHHLKIHDRVLELLLKDELQKLHLACAKTLGQVSSAAEMAEHNEKAGLLAEAARLYMAFALEIRVCNGTNIQVADICWKSLRCIGQRRAGAQPMDAGENALLDQLESRVSLVLISTWSITAAESTTLIDRR